MDDGSEMASSVFYWCLQGLLMKLGSLLTDVRNRDLLVKLGSLLTGVIDINPVAHHLYAFMPSTFAPAE